MHEITNYKQILYRYRNVFKLTKTFKKVTLGLSENEVIMKMFLDNF